MVTRKSYGGKVGVWLPKKRKRLNPPSQIIRSSLPASKKAIGRESWVLKSHPIENLVGWDDIRCRPIYTSQSQNTQAVKSVYDISAEQSISVNRINDDELDISHNVTPVRLSNGKEKIIKIKIKTAGTNQRKINKRVIRSYGSMKVCRKNGPSAATSSLLEHLRSPTNVNSRQCQRKFNRSKELGVLNKKLQNPRNTTSEADMADIPVSSLHSSAVKRILSDLPFNDTSGEFDFMMTPQPIVKSICSIMDSHGSIKVALSKNLKKDRIIYAPRTLILDNEDLSEGATNLLPRPAKSKTSTVKYCGTEYEHSQSSSNKRMYQPSSHTSLSDAKAFFAQLDATEELTIDTSKNKDDRRSKCSQNNRCVRTVRKRNLSDPSLLNDYASYRRASKESGLVPLALQMFAICQSDHFDKRRICDGLLEVD